MLDLGAIAKGAVAARQAFKEGRKEEYEKMMGDLENAIGMSKNIQQIRQEAELHPLEVQTRRAQIPYLKAQTEAVQAGTDVTKAQEYRTATDYGQKQEQESLYREGYKRITGEEPAMGKGKLEGLTDTLNNAYTNLKLLHNIPEQEVEADQEMLQLQIEQAKANLAKTLREKEMGGLTFDQFRKMQLDEEAKVLIADLRSKGANIPKSVISADTLQLYNEYLSNQRSEESASMKRTEFESGTPNERRNEALGLYRTVNNMITAVSADTKDANIINIAFKNAMEKGGLVAPMGVNITTKEGQNIAIKSYIDTLKRWGYNLGNKEIIDLANQTELDYMRWAKSVGVTPILGQAGEFLPNPAETPYMKRPPTQQDMNRSIGLPSSNVGQTQVADITMPQQQPSGTAPPKTSKILSSAPSAIKTTDDFNAVVNGILSTRGNQAAYNYVANSRTIFMRQFGWTPETINKILDNLR